MAPSTKLRQRTHARGAQRYIYFCASSSNRVEQTQTAGAREAGARTGSSSKEKRGLVGVLFFRAPGNLGIWTFATARPRGCGAHKTVNIIYIEAKVCLILLHNGRR